MKYNARRTFYLRFRFASNWRTTNKGSTKYLAMGEMEWVDTPFNSRKAPAGDRSYVN